MRRSIDPMEALQNEGSRPESASRTIVSMSLRLAIPQRVALQHCPPPLRQPILSLRKRSRFEKNNLFNSRCSYRKVSQRRGPPQASVDKIEDAKSSHFNKAPYSSTSC